jgi:hypothetical protein
MIYTQLDHTYRYRHIASAIYARELEFFLYEFDLVNFRHLVENMPDCEFRSDIEKRILETERQMNSVTAIIAALNSQIDDDAAYAEAVKYVTEKRKKEEDAK